MTDDEVRAALGHFEALWLTVKGEAESELIEGQIAVACVIRNRALTDLGHDGKPDWWGDGYKGVCLQPQQFSCWNPGSGANHDRLMATARLVVADYAERSAVPINAVTRQIRAVAECVMNGRFLDRTGGATHYLTKQLFETSPPAWARGRTDVIAIGSQVFLRA